MTIQVNKKYDPDCKGCDISQGKEKPLGGIVQISDRWILNHYGGEEGFLGWMCLQPTKHRMELAELDEEEAKELCPNIKRIEKAIRSYWDKHFSLDPIQRLYVVYFYESVFEEPKTKYHLHIHLIARSGSLGELLKSYDKYTRDGIDRLGWNINAWDIYRVSKRPDFPRQYCRNDQNVSSLMAYVKKHFQSQHRGTPTESPNPL